MNSEELYKIAYNLHYSEMDLEKATKKYDEIISEFPNSVEAGYARNQLSNIKRDGERYQAQKQREEEHKKSQVKLTTTNSIEGYRITETIDIIAAECAFGINIFRDLFASIRDVFGGRSGALQNVLRDAKDVCLNELRSEAKRKGGNAVIGVRLDYQEISGGGKSMLFLVATGTAVKVDKIDQEE